MSKRTSLTNSHHNLIRQALAADAVPYSNYLQNSSLRWLVPCRVQKDVFYIFMTISAHRQTFFFIPLNQNIMSTSLLEPQVKFNCFKFVSSLICTEKKKIKKEKSETISLDILLMNYCTQNALIIYIYISFFLLLFFLGYSSPTHPKSSCLQTQE